MRASSEALRKAFRASAFQQREARAARDVVQNLNKDRYCVVLKQVGAQSSQTNVGVQNDKYDLLLRIVSISSLFICRMWKARALLEM